jgi:hypothetical protein
VTKFYKSLAYHSFIHLIHKNISVKINYKFRCSSELPEYIILLQQYMKYITNMTVGKMAVHCDYETVLFGNDVMFTQPSITQIFE